MGLIKSASNVSCRWWFSVIAIAVVMGSSIPAADSPLTIIPKWSRFEGKLKSLKDYENPLHDVQVSALFVSPFGDEYTVDGFWDGGSNWKVRFLPNSAGLWKFRITCSDSGNQGLHGLSGTFLCTASRRGTIFEQHGPVRVSRFGIHLEHEDGTPFFWMADTAWNGALLSDSADWKHYLGKRSEQGFSAVQWVTTQWRAAPDGNAAGQKAFEGREKIRVNPAFFQRLDARMNAVSRAGLLGVPALLWAIQGDDNPGFMLPEDQAILLARYMLARWGANPAAWILGGDGDYRGEMAGRWKRIGKAVFGERPRFPVFLHPGGKQWIHKDFQEEKWLNAFGYQSGHSDDEKTSRWICSGPPAQDWAKDPPRPFINLEPPYENHLAYQSKKPISGQEVRRALYWSLLNAPTAGVSYGGHGVWGWDDGLGPPTAHPNSGTPLPWKQALLMPAAAHVLHLSEFFRSIDFWRLRPDPELLLEQPGAESPHRCVLASRSEAGDLAVFYTPAPVRLRVDLGRVPPNTKAAWVNPRSGERQGVAAVIRGAALECPTPGIGDWILLLYSGEQS